MTTIQEYDDFMQNLDQKISQNPKQKQRILMSEIQHTACPYLQEKIKRIYFDIS